MTSTDQTLGTISEEPTYFVDYIWDASVVDGEKILEIANMNDYWGKDIDRAMVLIKNITVNSDTFKVMKSNTLKYRIPGIDIIQFGGTDEEIEMFGTGVHTINAVCKCVANEWNWQIDPQLIMVDYELVDKEPTVLDWGF